MNKQINGGFSLISNACEQDNRLEVMAQEYVDNKNKRDNGFHGLARGINDPKTALKAVMPHKKDEFDASYYEDINRVPKCSDEVRSKIFYMLALKKAAIKKGQDRNRNYKPYFDLLFKKVDNAKKEQAMQKLQDVYQIKLEDSEQVSKSGMNSTPLSETTATDTTGGARKYTKNLCHKKSVKKPNKCKKVKGCKVAKGTKRSYCRKAKNSTKSKKK